MTFPPSDSQIDLRELAQRLSLEGMPPQAVIAAEAGVSQPTVSRATRSQIKTVSRSVRKLWGYTEKRLEVLQADPSRSVTIFATNKASANPPNALPSHQKTRRRAKPLPRHPATPASGPRSDDRAELAKAALDGLRDYLADKFDPRLVIEQLAVLRRAQDYARRREDS